MRARARRSARFAFECILVFSRRARRYVLYAYASGPRPFLGMPYEWPHYLRYFCREPPALMMPRRRAGALEHYASCATIGTIMPSLKPGFSHLLIIDALHDAARWRAAGRKRRRNESLQQHRAPTPISLLHISPRYAC